MAIAEQFAGLQMDQLIGAPLRAAADASTLLANSTADFINRVGFDGEGKIRTVAFGYQKRSANDDGTSNLDEMKVDVPMLAIVPIPNLQVDEVNILFDMEVKQSERSESSMDLGASITGSINLGIAKVSVTGSVSAHQSNTRSSDNSAKYHVDVRATNHGTPEGLARVLDMMAANVAPMLVGSSLKDGNGQELPEKSRVKAERLKGIRQEISQIENQLNTAKGNLEDCIRQLKSLAGSQLSVYQGKITSLLNQPNTDDASADTYNSTMDAVNQSWNGLQNQTRSMVELLASDTSGQSVFVMLGVKALNAEATSTANYESSESYYASIDAAQAKAVESQKNVKKLEEQLLNKKSEYSDMIAGVTTS